MLVAGKEKRITSKMTYFDRFVTNILNGLQGCSNLKLVSKVILEKSLTWFSYSKLNTKELSPLNQSLRQKPPIRS